MNKIELAYELLRNTENKNLVDLIHQVISNLEGQCIRIPLSEEVIRFQDCLKYLEEKAFNIKGWCLIESPIYYTYCFADIRNNRFFDLAVSYMGKVVPKYIDTADNEIVVETIQISINNYYRLQTYVADYNSF